MRPAFALVEAPRADIVAEAFEPISAELLRAPEQQDGHAPTRMIGPDEDHAQQAIADLDEADNLALVGLGQMHLAPFGPEARAEIARPALFELRRVEDAGSRSG